MKKHLVIIHGGDSYESYEDFVEALKASEPVLDDFKKGSHNTRIWREDLEDKLQPEYEVLQPRMPNKDYARYSEWKIWFEKLIPMLNKGTVFIGHSMGGIFLAKYFAEKGDFLDTRGLFLVAAPFDDNPSEYSVVDFRLPKDLSRLKALGARVHLYASEDDDVVPFGDVKKYQAALPEAQSRIFKDRGHFKVDTLPEILEDIKNLPE